MMTQLKILTKPSIVKSDLSSVRVCTVAYTGQVTFYKVPKKTRPCLSGQVLSKFQQIWYASLRFCIRKRNSV